ncbi:MAG: DUF192 domain-containing protein, partial [Candidatus Bipolaricaulia bacterium]
MHLIRYWRYVINYHRLVGKDFIWASLLGISLLIALPGLSPVLAEADSGEGDLPSDLTLVKQSRWLIAEHGNEVWPGFGDNPAPVLLRSGENDYLLGHPDPPAGFKKVKGKPNLHVKEGHLLSQTVATAYPVNGTWSVVIPVREELIGWVKNEMGNSTFQLSRADYLQALIHESFHAYQIGSLGGPKEVPTFGFSGSSRALEKQLSDEEWWEARTNEIGELLVRGLKADELSGVRNLTGRALNHTKNGSKNLNSTVRSFEHHLQWLEGTARYAGTRTIMEAYGYDPGSGEEIELQSPSRARSNLLNQLTSPLSGPTPVRDMLAAMGAAKAMILDRLYPGWKNGFLSGLRSLDELLEVGISVPDPLTDFPVTEVRLNERKLTVALANNSSRRAHGLKYVTNLDPLSGMVFTFPREVNTGFWMKDTKISLQIGFFDSSGKLQESVVLDPCNS